MQPHFVLLNPVIASPSSQKAQWSSEWFLSFLREMNPAECRLKPTANNIVSGGLKPAIAGIHSGDSNV